jgi:hypothetical protein
MMALLAFPDTPAVGVCHGAAQWEETPIAHPRLVRHVAVDDACYARVCDTPGIPVAAIRVVLNFVDLARVPPRGPLPARIGRAAVLNNEINEANVLPAIRAACAARGIVVDAFGAASGRPLDAPGTVIGEYDLVFGKARCALEAMAAGSAVVLCAASGLGSMVTSADFDRLRRLNFGFRTLDRQVTAESVSAELDRFDPDDAARVQHRVRTEANLTAAADQWEQVYDEALAAFATKGPRDRDAEGRAASAYLRSISAIFKAGFATHSELIRLRAGIATARPRPGSRAASE